MKRRALRWALAGLAALAFVQLVRTWEAMGRDVIVTYEVGGAGPLTVRLYGDDNDLIRRTEFRRAPFQHQISLPDGDYRAVCRRGGVEQGWDHVHVRADGPIEVRCAPR